MTSTSTKRTYTNLNKVTYEEKREYTLAKKREYARRYREKDPEKINNQALTAVKKWYSNEENKTIKILKNKMRWYLLNIKKLEDDYDNINKRQIKRLSTLKNMLNNLLQEHPEILRLSAEQDDNVDTN
jgi:hypothetical protein